MSHFLGFDQTVNSIEGYTTIIADDTSTSVSIRQTGYYMGLSCQTHFRGISSEYRIIMSRHIRREDLFQFRVNLITIGFCCLGSHFDAAIGHKCSL